MFDGLGSMMKLLGNKDKIAAEAGKLHETIAGLTADGAAGDGMVAVRVNGRMEVLSVRFTDAALTQTPAALGDMTAAALNQALAGAREQVAAETKKLAASLGLPAGLLANIPGLG